jgi:hypothetical protein
LSGGKLDGLVLVELLSRSARDAVVIGDREVLAPTLRPGAPVLDVIGEASLPQIEVDGGDPLSERHQGGGDVHGNGGLARTSLFVPEHDDVRGRRPPAIRLHQHDIPSPKADPLVSFPGGAVGAAPL